MSLVVQYNSTRSNSGNYNRYDSDDQGYIKDDNLTNLKEAEEAKEVLVETI